MSFYTPNWVRKLAKEDHKAIQEHIAKTGKDFRSYIDSTLPFTLYLDIDLIRDRILYKQETTQWIEELARLIYVNPNSILAEIDLTYRKVINFYATNPKYLQISSQDLAIKLQRLADASASGFNIKSTIQQEFKGTMVITNITKLNKQVMLILPKFTTLEFGKVFKEQFDYSKFSDLISDDPENRDSPRNLLKDFINKNFARLQNIGHVEVDVISTAEASKEIKRGQNSPRLLQALLALPKDVKPERIAREFSNATGQAETRIIVRKKFTTSKLVFEMLVEYGMSVGIPETQKTNLQKAALEKAFSIGAGLTSQIRANKNFLVDLETSKSIKQFVAESVIDSIKGKRSQTYASNTLIKVSTPVVVPVLKLKLDRKSSISKPLPKLKVAKQENRGIASLQSLLDSSLFEQIKKNMGKGNAKNILNFRTGRFAKSAKVERLSASREGMITAFYTYMKNPYATFSAGGMQQNPKTRDPKLLISKSIRELGATLAYNRMRAVLV